MIIQETDTNNGLLVFRNSGKVYAEGLGLEYRYQDPEGFQGRVSYTLQRVQDDLSGLRLVDSPQQLLKASFIAPLLEDKLSASAEFQYSGDSLGYNGGQSPEYAVVNFKLHSQDLGMEGLEGTLAVYNLFDAKYSLPVANYPLRDTFPQNGLTLWAMIGYKL